MLKFWKRLMFYKGVFFVSMGTYVMSLWLMHFGKVHSIGPINVCNDFEANRYKIDDFRKHAKIVGFIWRHGTQKRYVARHMSHRCRHDCMIHVGISIRNIFKLFRSLYDFQFKCHGSNSGFHVLVTLTFDLSFIIIGSALIGDIAADTRTHIHIHKIPR